MVDGIGIKSIAIQRVFQVTTKAGKHTKHIPQRTCVGCHLVLPKRQLIRVVRTPEGIMVDPIGKMAGRGAYLHNRRVCWEKGIKGAIANALKTTLTDQDRERLTAFLVTLPESLPDEVEGASHEVNPR